MPKSNGGSIVCCCGKRQSICRIAFGAFRRRHNRSRDSQWLLYTDRYCRAFQRRVIRISTGESLVGCRIPVRRKGCLRSIWQCRFVQRGLRCKELFLHLACPFGLHTGCHKLEQRLVKVKFYIALRIAEQYHWKRICVVQFWRFVQFHAWRAWVFLYIRPACFGLCRRNWKN